MLPATHASLPPMYNNGGGGEASVGEDDDLIELVRYLSGLEEQQDSIDTDSSESQVATATRNRRYLRRLHQESTNIKDVRKAGGVYLKRRGDGRMVTHTIRPRILKSDVRRSYAQMICNIDNSGDPRLLLTFLDTFSLPTFMFQSVAHQCAQGSNEAQAFSIVGPDHYVQLWEQMGDLTPDKTTRLLSSWVLARSDGTGELKCIVELSGTMLVTRDDPTPWRQVGLDIDEFFGSPEEIGCIAGTLGEPAQASSARLISMVTVVTATLHLDTQNRILRYIVSQGVPRFSEVAAPL